jgi:drug/metabolite transporter (DMT)-like permease
VLGETFALASAIAWGISGTMLKMVAPRFGAVYIVAVRAVTSLLFALVVAAAVGVVDSLGTLAMFTVLLLIASGSAAIVGHVSFVKALSIDQISRVFPTTNGLYIMFSVVGTIIISDESVTWRTVGGGLLVLGGIYVLSVRRQQEATRQTEGGFKLLALVLSAVTGLTWAVSVIVQNDIVEHTNPILANAIRTVVMVVIGLTMVGLSANRGVQQGSRRDYMIMFGSGLANGVSALLFMSALKWSSPATVVVLNSTAPLFAVPMAFLLLHERMTGKLLLGTVTSLAGVALTLS